MARTLGLGTHQALQEPGRPGDDDEDLLNEQRDDGHFLALRPLVGL